jgi:hypothetical protein
MNLVWLGKTLDEKKGKYSGFPKQHKRKPRGCQSRKKGPSTGAGFAEKAARDNGRGRTRNTKG